MDDNFFICRKCGQRVDYARKDGGWMRKFYETLGWECESCRVVIANRNYPVNLKGETTYFSPLGEALGDQIRCEVIKRRYRADNPDENVVFLKEWSADVLRSGARKIFFANLHSGSVAFTPEQVIWFSISNEIRAFAEQEHYPEYKINKEIISKKLKKMKNFIILHFRKVAKVERKNIETHYVYAILKLLKSLKIKKVIIVGNDDDNDGLSQKELEYVLGILPLIDMRHKLNLNEIAFLCRHAKLYIGKDSGIAHLAAAAGCKNMVCWGFDTERYFPSVPEGICQAWETKDTSIGKILGEIEKKLGKGRGRGKD